MNYYDRIIELISEVTVRARVVNQKPQQVKKHTTGRVDYRDDQQADIEDATRILRRKRRDLLSKK
jgi:hypothetical protein